MNKLFSSFDLQVYCFLFVVDNYFAKIFITCNKDYEPEEFQDIITEAIKRIKS